MKKIHNFQKTISIIMSITMLSAALSFETSAAVLYSEQQEVSLNSEEEWDIGPAIAAYPTKEGILYVTTGNNTGSYTQHWIEPWEGEPFLEDKLYVFITEITEEGIKCSLTDPEGKTTYWIEDKPAEELVEEPIEISDEEAEMLIVNELKRKANDGEIDKELGYELLDAVYEEQNAYAKAVKFYTEKADLLKSSAKNASNVKRTLAAALTSERKKQLQVYISNCNNKAAYFTKRASSLKSMLKTASNEINRLTKALNSIKTGNIEEKTYVVPKYEGTAQGIDYSTMRFTYDAYWGYWTSYRFADTVDVDIKSGIYWDDPDEPIIGMDADMAFLLQLSSQPGNPIEMFEDENGPVYLAYIKGEVYQVDEKGKKLNIRTWFDTKKVVNDIVDMYEIKDSIPALNAIYEETDVYNNAAKFYEKKAEDLKEIVNFLKSYQKENSKSMSTKDKATLNSYIKAYNSSANYYSKRAKSISSMLKIAETEKKRLCKVLEVEGKASDNTRSYSFWKRALRSGQFNTTGLYDINE